MTTAQVGYAPIYPWVKQVLGHTHTTVVGTVCWAVLCLLGAQRVTPAALARALPGEHAGSGRSCLRRVRRWWSGPALDQPIISPALLRLALTLLPSGHPVVVALDTTRLGPWEVWLAGIVVGLSNEISGDFASVSGGTGNAASGVLASVSAGEQNTASGFSSSVSGGHTNAASGSEASVSGGINNTASGDFASVSGGSNRSAPGTEDWAAGDLFQDL